MKNTSELDMKTALWTRESLTYQTLDTIAEAPAFAFIVISQLPVILQ
jgi:hypothetical protein